MLSQTLEIKTLFEQPGPPAYPFRDDRGQLCWLEALTEEGGRLAIKQMTPEGERVVTPADYQIRTRVHEYGGQCFCIVADTVYFNHFSDGLIYRQNLHNDEPPHAISMPGSESSCYADLHYSHARNAIVAVQEINLEKGENCNQIVAFPLDSKTATTPQVLLEGADFYAAPCISNAGDQLAWIEWSHPYMPWDETRLLSASISSAGDQLSLGPRGMIAGGAGQSICQPGFLRDGTLLFAMDRDAPVNNARNYWNLYRSQDATVTELTQESVEFGEAHWIFGQRRWVQTGHNTLQAIATRNQGDCLYEIELNSSRARVISGNYSRISQLCFTGDDTLCIASYPDRPMEIVACQAKGLMRTVKSQTTWIDPSDVSLPELMCYPTNDGEQAYAHYYAAKPESSQSRSALLVLVHGGPTARSDTTLSPLVQYFCQNGFSILDINHRGSTGHGRAFRQKLLQQWGEIDAADIADAIAYSLTQKQLNPRQVFIRGGSAGGYAVLRALTRYPDLFSGGGCYYGIGNLITLSEITHKFEGRYTDRLIGETYHPEKANLAGSRFRSRSPIFDIDRISSPLILFQGLDDKVVPPEVSREMVETLAGNGVQHEYIEYPGEGHGFRKAETRIDSLSREIAFYKQILGEK